MAIDINKIPIEQQRAIAAHVGLNNPDDVEPILWHLSKNPEKFAKLLKGLNIDIDVATLEADPEEREPEWISNSAEMAMGPRGLPMSNNIEDRRDEPRLPLIKTHLHDTFVRPFEEAYEDIRSGNMFRTRPQSAEIGFMTIGGPPDFSGSKDAIEEIIKRGGQVSRMPDELINAPDEDETMLGVP